MKRAIAVVLVLAVTLVALVPILDCPDCHGVGESLEGFSIGCPRCADRGRISTFERVRRRPVDPDLAALVVEPWVSTHGGRFSDLLIRLSSRESWPLSPNVEWTGLAGFAEDRVVVLARRARMPAGPAEDVALLFDRDGALLDGLEIVSAQGALDLDARFPRGGLIRIEAPAGQGPHRFHVRGKSGASELRGSALTLRPAGDRFGIVPEP